MQKDIENKQVILRLEARMDTIPDLQVIPAGAYSNGYWDIPMNDRISIGSGCFQVTQKPPAY